MRLLSPDTARTQRAQQDIATVLTRNDLDAAVAMLESKQRAIEADIATARATLADVRAQCQEAEAQLAQLDEQIAERERIVATHH